MVKVPIWTPFTGARIWMPLGDLLHLDQIRRHFAHRSADEPASQLYELILRSRTPNPPSASKMKSTPAASSVRRTAAKLETVIASRPSVASARRIVATPKLAFIAKSAALQRIRARAALICGLVISLSLYDFLSIIYELCIHMISSYS